MKKILLLCMLVSLAAAGCLGTSQDGDPGIADISRIYENGITTVGTWDTDSPTVDDGGAGVTDSPEPQPGDPANSREGAFLKCMKRYDDEEFCRNPVNIGRQISENADADEKGQALREAHPEAADSDDRNVGQLPDDVAGVGDDAPAGDDLAAERAAEEIISGATATAYGLDAMGEMTVVDGSDDEGAGIELDHLRGNWFCNAEVISTGQYFMAPVGIGYDVQDDVYTVRISGSDIYPGFNTTFTLEETGASDQLELVDEDGVTYFVLEDVRIGATTLSFTRDQLGGEFTSSSGLGGSDIHFGCTQTD